MWPTDFMTIMNYDCNGQAPLSLLLEDHLQQKVGIQLQQRGSYYT